MDESRYAILVVKVCFELIYRYGASVAVSAVVNRYVR